METMVGRMAEKGKKNVNEWSRSETEASTSQKLEKEFKTRR
jgi:hypothetical protein